MPKFKKKNTEILLNLDNRTYLQCLAEITIGDWAEGIGLVDSGNMRAFVRHIAKVCLRILEQK